MKRLFTIFGVLLILLNVANAQDCSFKMTKTVIPASCYNNGQVAYALTDGSGTVLTSAPTGLSEVRAYYIEEGDTVKHYSGFYLVDATGSMTSANGWDTLTVNYGNYTFGVEGLCNDGGTITKVDTQMTVEIPTTYVKPSASALYVTANTTDGFGKRPTLDCDNTGRIQLKIENGSYPYTIAVVNHNTGDTLRTVVFDGPQYDGEDLTLYNYKDYYTVDSLPGGDWDFYLVDGCDYGLPRTGQTVEVINFPLLDYVEVFASSGDMTDDNVLKINAVLDQDYSYYTSLMPDYAEYRLSYDGTPSSDWKPFPAVLEGYRATLYDTVGNDYCDTWGKTITLEYRLKQCGNTTVSKTFTINKPDESYYQRDYSDTRDSTYIQENTCMDMWYWHRWFHEISYPYNWTDKVTQNNDDPKYRHHYTHPLTWLYIDTETGDTIKKDKINSISHYSRLYDVEVESIYGSFRDYTASNPLNLPIRRVLVDANGCELYSRFDSLPYCYDVGTQIVDWEMTRTSGDHCCQHESSIRVYENHSSAMDPDGSTIALIQSPRNNSYNFTAVYSSETKTWTVNKESLENVATINGAANGRSLTFKDYCLPSGPYKFKIMTPCDTFILQENYTFPDVYTTEMTEEPVFSSAQQCTDHYITYTAGGFSRITWSTDPTTGLDNPPVEEALTTYFQIISGPTGGYDGTMHKKNEQLRISMPGTYVVHIFPSTSLEVCEMPEYYDTVDYDGATVEFQYAYAFLCDSTCTQGTAYVKGTNGTPPYTYTLFSEADKQGDTLQVLTISDTTQPAIFSDQLMNSQQEMSCLIEDACGAYFHVNFPPRTMADLQKLWFDDGLTTTETCEGSTIEVHALEIGSILEYKWYNPDMELIDSVSSPSIFIPRGAKDGWYKVVIKNTGCTDSIVDSVYLTVKDAPDITLNSNATVCPGEEVNLEFTPTSATGDDITFTIAFENGDSIETRTYTTASGDTVGDLYATYTNAKIYPISINDGNCDYTLADEHDTIYVTMKEEVADACTLLGSHDTVCYGSDAQFAALSTMEKPYTIRWYSDYELTHLLKEETMTETGPDTSYYDTLALTQHAEVFVSVQKDGYCPTIYGLPNTSVNMTTGTTDLLCGKVLRVYDNGGADGDYTVSQTVTHTYTTTDGKPVTIQFEDFDLSETAHLFIISGSSLSADSVLYELTADSENPGLITTNGDALTLYFIPGMKAASGWSAIVEHSPGKAIADIYEKSESYIRDYVCQSQTNTYDDIYSVVPDIVPDIATLNSNIRKAGVYMYSDTIFGAAQHGCDSIVNFVLTVEPPATYDTTVVITNVIGSYYWPNKDTTLTTTGRYTKLTTLANGCDSLDILDLIIIQIDTVGDEVCEGEEGTVRVMATVPDLSSMQDDLVPPAINIGDVMCTDGSIMNPDDYVASGKTNAMGVVFYVDSTGSHGLVTALTDASTSTLAWTTDKNNVRSYTVARNVATARQDFGGYQNTLHLKETAEAVGEFSVKAPAAYHCYYYDHRTENVGPTHLGWYMPSCGEMNLLYMNRFDVNTSLAKLSKNSLRNGGYWGSTGEEYNNHTSTWYNSDAPYWIDSDGGVRDGQYTKFHVRPIMSF